MKTVLILFNQLLSPQLSSGGDVRCAETIKRWKNLDIKIVGPVFASFLKEDLKASTFHPLPRNPVEVLFAKKKAIFLIAPLYVWRGISAVRLLSNLTFDVLYTTGDFVCNTLPAYIIKKRDPATKWVANIFHINAPPGEREKNKFLFALGSFLLQRISFILLKKADLIFLLNNDVKDALTRRGFDPQKLIVLGAGFDFAEIEKTRQEKVRRNDVIFLGRLNLTKGVFDLPKIWPLVLDQVTNARLILIGAGEEKTITDLKKSFDKARVLPTVSFRGFIKESKEVYKIMKQSKVFVLPSYEEGWGIAVFEAIACGLAPVVYDLAVFREIFGRSIKTVPAGDTAVFAAEIVRLLKNPKLRKDYTLRLGKMIKKYDWGKIARKELDLLKEFVE